MIVTRPADPADLERIVELCIHDAAARAAMDGTLWKMAEDARDKLASTIETALRATNPAFRQQWIVAETAGELVGVSHSIRLPVPPIYAGAQGAPGLLMEDSCVVADAPPGTAERLLAAAETDLIHSGAQVLLASSVTGGTWEAVYTARGYEPLTLYLGKVGLDRPAQTPAVRPADAADITNIVDFSAQNRQVLYDLDTFWLPHPEADERFGSWMAKSLSLPDRDMFVAESDGEFAGYAISQPVTALHMPAAHDISGTGIIDDFFHKAFADPEPTGDRSAAAGPLLAAAEMARKGRGDEAVLIVCPAAWSSKIALLEDAGYQIALTWYIKR